MKKYQVSGLEQIYQGNHKETLFRVSELTPNEPWESSWISLGLFSCKGHIKKASTIEKHIESGKINIFEDKENQEEYYVISNPYKGE